MDNMISAMVTGAGAPGIAGTIYSLRNNPDKLKFKIVSVDMKDEVVGQYLSDQFYTIPSPEDHDYIPVLQKIVEKENISVVLPQTTKEIVKLSQFKQLFNEMGVRVLVSDYESIIKANDKFLLLELSRKLGIPHPSYYLTQTESHFIKAVTELGYPNKKVAIKPRISHGMRGFRILAKKPYSLKTFLNEKPAGVETDLESIVKIFRNDQWPELLVTDYLDDAEYTVDIFRNQLQMVVIPRKRESIRSGITFESVVDLRDDLINYSKSLTEALDLMYCFGFQFKLSSDGTPKILECNPRVQGTMVVSTFAGFNMIYYAVKQALENQDSITKVLLKDNFRFKRYWGGVAIDNENCIGRI